MNERADTGKTETIKAADGQEAGSAEGYQVLARKYRPSTFGDLIGQEALVQTLTNAFRTGRLAHAFILTGVRGVGKTTTARIIARALNCIGEDGKRDAPTITPCGVCEPCRAIAEDRHVDVLEMDAASRTGVDDIRDIIDGVRYRPASARYKVYIIDEVHMLSRNAFNALLKTLEEPPEHVTFIFATTEVRKVPVTVLSRCQRFDLRRVDAETLREHFKNISQQEGVSVDPAALGLIAGAADGSVRDGLSLLDQAIAHSAGEVNEETVRGMLGLNDRAVIFDILDAVMKGEAGQALSLLDDQYNAGADPLMILQDLLDLVHWLTRIKVVPEVLDDPTIAEIERERGRAMAEGLSMAHLARAWQMVLKGLNEARISPSPVQAAEMILIRLAYAADLPTPGEAVKAIKETPPSGGEKTERSRPPSASGGADADPAPTSSSGGRTVTEDTAHQPEDSRPRAMAVNGATAQDPPVQYEQYEHHEQDAEPQSHAHPKGLITRFEDIVRLAEERGERLLRSNLFNYVHLVRFAPPQLEIRPARHAAEDLVRRLNTFLTNETGERWVVVVSREDGMPTLAEQREAEEEARKQEVASDPLVAKVLETFPGAKITAVRDLTDEEDAVPAAGAEDGGMENEMNGTNFQDDDEGDA